MGGGGKGETNGSGYHVTGVYVTERSHAGCVIMHGEKGIKDMLSYAVISSGVKITVYLNRKIYILFKADVDRTRHVINVEYASGGGGGGKGVK